MIPSRCIGGKLTHYTEGVPEGFVLPLVEKGGRDSLTQSQNYSPENPLPDHESVPILLKAVLTHAPTRGLLLEQAGFPDMEVGGDCCCFHLIIPRAQ